MKNYQKQKMMQSTIIRSFMVVFTIIAVLPIWLMLVNATRSTPEINSGISLFPSIHSLDNWRILTGRGFKLAIGFRNSLVISLFVTVFSTYFSALVAYGIHVYRFKGRDFLWKVIMMLIMLPATLSFIGFVQFMSKIHLMNSFIPLIIPSIANSFAKVIFFPVTSPLKLNPVPEI